VTPRGTDWGLALVVALLFATGMASLFAASDGEAWVFAAHDVLAFALALLLVVKMRRVWRRLVSPAEWDRQVKAGVIATLFVALALLSGWVWSGGGRIAIGGFTLLSWHLVLGWVLTAAVNVHAVLRRKPTLVRRDLAGRRQFLVAGGGALGAVALWRVQRPVSAFFGLRSAQRRFTGSYEAASFEGNAFPSTSWVADSPRALDPASYTLAVTGLVHRPLTLRLDELNRGQQLKATLDCTGGFYSTQHWRGVSLGALIDRAGALPKAGHVRVVSHTGYRWSFDLRTARGLLLATHVGGEPLSHDHGAPVRLVAPDRRGFEWVKWVTGIELHEHPDPGAAASTVWSSLTARGRGADT
jgi:DMSO/TMAO reductase YedYZ molybdopterin-dependent catalytic subunit